MKRAMLTIMRSCGLFAFFRSVNQRKVLIITYHRFNNSEDGRSISARLFEEQLVYLKKHYRLMRLSEIEDCLTNNRPLPARVAAVTIDDGFSDTYEIAFPLLREHRVPAALFVITDFIDKKIWLWTDKLRYMTALAPAGSTTIKFGDHELRFELDGSFSRLVAATKVNEILKTLPENVRDLAIEEVSAGLNVAIPILPPSEYGAVSWEQVAEMDLAGIEIGSHTVSHPILPNVGDGQLDRELTASRARLESILNHPVTLFCYPNGSYDRRTQLAVAKAGYRCAVTTEARLNRQSGDPLALSRVPAEHDLDHFVQTTCGFEEAKNLLRPRPA